ncbi:hypothetical protein L2E82_12537 [Cichorium intybus]|uniref:Uncharacterized protein n=1 Tax=Cichorium intybus TaxID=13427 RepID=A0ACB9GG40_CICIN|nr:hypothetical protein L2E82_12537 [Cichorium intybus]
MARYTEINLDPPKTLKPSSDYLCSVCREYEVADTERNGSPGKMPTSIFEVATCKTCVQISQVDYKGHESLEDESAGAMEQLREAESEAKALHTRTWNRLKVIPLSGDAVDKLKMIVEFILNKCDILLFKY